MDISFIGFGEAAFELAKGLKSEGIKKIYAFDPLLANPQSRILIESRMKESEVIVKESLEEIVHSSKCLIAAVPANKALEVGLEVEKILTDKKIYIDVSASSPDVKKKLANNFIKFNTLFVDAAMLGPLIQYQHKVPMLISGSGADRFLKMNNYGMNIKKISDTSGHASAVKLIRSIYMKGLAALSIETLEIAKELNVEDYVIDSLKETMESSSFEERLSSLVTGTAIHSERRAVEIEGSITMLENQKIDSLLTTAIKEKLSLISEYSLAEYFNGNRPDHWTEVIELIKEKRLSTSF